MAEPAAAGAPAHRAAPPWLFFLLAVPFGVAGSYTSTSFNYILNQNQVDPAKADTAVALSVLVAGVQFLWAPLMDIKLRRRSWFVVVSFAGAALMIAAMATPVKAHTDLFIGLTLAAQVAICLTSACNGALMANTVPNERRGLAAGFSNAGNIGFGAITSGVTLQLVDRVRLPVVGLVIGAMLALPSLLVLMIDEPEPPRRGAAETFRAMARDVWNTVKRREGWSGYLLCLSPVGTAAAMQLFTGKFAETYHPSPAMIAVNNGYLGGLITGASCMVGGILCDRFRRRSAYLAAGALTALVAIAFALAPCSPRTYAWGTLLYLAVTGFCYAAFTAFVLEVIGAARDTAATQYTLFTAAGNQAIAYVIKLDGVGRGFYERHVDAAHSGRGLLYTDALLNLVGIALFTGLLALLRPTRGRASASSAP